MFKKEVNHRSEFMFNIIVQIIMYAVMATALGWPMQVVVNWASDSFSFGTTINFFEGIAFAATGIALYHFLPRIPFPFQFHNRD